MVLKQVYDESTPKTLSQWWHDRRNGVQWYTFWVAIVVLRADFILWLRTEHRRSTAGLQGICYRLIAEFGRSWIVQR